MATWSALRKELEEDRLCPALRGRVQYFATHYHGAPDDYGRVCVRVDGKEYLLVTAGAEGTAYTEPYHVLDALKVYGEYLRE